MTQLSEIDFPTRINISYLLSPEIHDYAAAANQTIFDFGGEFEFVPAGRAIPHITMLMGEVDGPADYHAVSSTIKELVGTFSPIDYQISAPYFRDRSQRFVFVDTNPQEEFYLQRVRIEERLAGHLDVDHYGGASNVSHITLGFLAKGGTESLLSELIATRPDLSGRALTLQLALTGPRGTCVETLATFAVG